MVSEVRLGTAAGRWVVAATVLGSGMAFLDSTVINIALPAIGHDLGTGLGGLQWTLDGYLLTLAALILLGGSLADRYGRRRVFIIGTVWFALASLLCAVSPTIEVLVAARGLQGIGAALLTPVSLAILQTGLAPADRTRAIAAWSGLTGVAIAIGPVVGGWLIDVASWQWIFVINLPMAVAVVVVALRYIPESRDPSPRGLDWIGALVGAVSLAALTYGFIRWGERGLGGLTGFAVAVGVVGLVVFVVVERRSPCPMLPPGLFTNRRFTGTNLVTLGLYAALSSALFILVVRLQNELHYSPLAAGVATVPITLLMLSGSDLAGRISNRIGPQLPLTVGPLVAGLGLTIVVAPLTATVLAAADDALAGIASGVNNAIARTGGLLGVAVVPLLAGGASGTAYRYAMWITAGMAMVAGVVGFFSLAGSRPVPVEARAPEAQAPAGEVPVGAQA